MSMAGSRRIKLSANMRPFVSRVVTNGRVQRAFAEQIGRPVGACVAGRVHSGMNIGDIRKAVKDCAASKRGTKLSF